MSSLAQTHSTEAQYLAWEREAEHRSEFVNGQIYAVAGASPEHAIITVNLGRELSAQLKGRPCRTYSTDIRVRVSETGMYTYPDVVVACGENEFHVHNGRREALLNPTLIVEVLSDSTGAYDRGEKFAHYQSLSSLQEYVLVAQDQPRIERFLRQADGQWLYSAVSGREEALDLTSLGCRLALAEVYDNVDFAASESANGAASEG